MKVLKIKIAALALFALTAMASCKKDNVPDEESYGNHETARDQTPTENDEATNDTSDHEIGPGSATVGDTVNKTP